APEDPFGDSEGGINREYQDYLSTYQDIRDALKELAKEDKESIVDDLVFEMELVKQVQVDVTYILELVEKYRAAHGDGEDKEIKAQIKRAVAASPQLRDKQELIDAFIQANAVADAGEDWFDFVRARKDMEIRSLIARENLNEDATFDFLERCFESGYVPESGAGVAKMLPKMSRFTPGGERDALKARVLQEMSAIFNRYEGLIE
ncbi:MAG: type I restriction endonuclease subunit R, partial [Actinomycetaceae bacterium]|nr:type I restriction endonuclease subunit R [Actinomycetaceae bacterium]